MKTNENFQYVLDLCRDLIEDEYKPCNLEKDIKERLYELILIWEKRKEKALRENIEIGGLKVLFRDVKRAVGKAKSDERRFKKKTKYQYLKRGLNISIGEPGAFGNWFLKLREHRRVVLRTSR